MSGVKPGCCSGDGSTTQPTLVKTTMPLYEYRDVWAEEGGGMANSNYQWSFGNGATGLIGLPIDNGWEIFGIYYQADTFPSAANLSVNVVNIKNAASPQLLTTISLTGAADGGGQTNNASKFQDVTPPAQVPDNSVIAFQTNIESGGAVGDARVGVRLRRQIGEYVVDVQLV